MNYLSYIETILSRVIPLLNNDEGAKTLFKLLLKFKNVHVFCLFLFIFALNNVSKPRRYVIFK